VITREEAERLRERLLTVLRDDGHDAARMLVRLETIGKESGVDASSALLLILTNLVFAGAEARSHWRGILDHRGRLETQLGRDPGVRTALVDYFMNIDRRLVQPTLVDDDSFDGCERGEDLDALTSLQTGRTFHRSVHAELRRARRYDQRMSVVLFDLDDFERVNARCGRAFGDATLVEVARLLTRQVREIDGVARPGEDELALLLPETPRSGARLVAERFRSVLESRFAGELRLTVSGGFASYPDDASSPEILLERAAQALYLSKALGKNTVRPYEQERRGFLRFEVPEERFSIEFPAHGTSGRLVNFSRSGILFRASQRFRVGDAVELRLVDRSAPDSLPGPRIRGRVARLVSTDAGNERRIGVAFERQKTNPLVEFLESSRHGAPSPRP